MEQTPSKLLKEKNILLSGLRHIQLHYPDEQRERNKYSEKSL